MEIACKLSEVEANLERLKLCDDKAFVIEQTEEHRIVADSVYVHVIDLDLDLREGSFDVFSDSFSDYMTDFSFVAVFSHGSHNYLYFENDGFCLTLHNYLHGSGRDISDICVPDLDCVIHIDDDIIL